MSVKAPGATVLTIITLFFAPVFVGHGHHRHRVEHRVKRTVAHKIVPCKVDKPCPKTKTETIKVYLKHAPKKHHHSKKHKK